MGYKNGKYVLPVELLTELQKYIQGELIYIPKQGNQRSGWGENNGTRFAIRKRNFEIYNSHKAGTTIKALVDIYHLSEDSIRKIIVKTSRDNNANLPKEQAKSLSLR